ncbi:MAG: 3-deoxy-8-phosphooctulonate synthase [Puniceicoccales bacterium]|jgi:2-dehydro-3-deoxyphosphooctonate aldolase (KDO 8-P synthase)|nr:3-deoxy-8-phosphooctulonate synthase [Puniceicoccales bacterium]
MEKFLLIAGPCLLESEGLAMEVAEELAQIQSRHGDLRVIFKASVDKANRSSVHSARGVGLDRGLEILDAVRERFSLPITTDFHEPAQAERVAAVCDVVQVPAFLCRQTDMLAAAARTGREVSVKKGQFLSPWDMAGVVEKLRFFGAKTIYQMERGATFGYGQLVVDMRSFQVMRQNGCPVVYDLTHSLQLPAMGNASTGGAREFADTLARAAIGAGIDGFFIETHPDPDRALCDRDCQLPLHTLGERVDRFLELQGAIRKIWPLP